MTETFSLTLEQAQAYENVFVPALFAQWVQPLLGCAGLAEGHRVLDVACGTGVVARAAARAVGPAGRVCGIDLNPSMLQVARQVQPDLDWRVGDAANLPYEDGSFDAVLCQSALFFFGDPAGAVREMARVTAVGGVVALQTYAGLDEQPGYGPFVDVVVRHSGPDARSLLDTYWSAGDPVQLRMLLESAGLLVGPIQSLLGHVAFPSVDALVETEIRATPLAGRIDEATIGTIGQEAREVLAPYRVGNGTFAIPIRARFACGRKASAIVNHAR